MRTVVVLLLVVLAHAQLLAQHVLTLAGEAPTALTSASGGFAEADVIVQALGTSPFPRKHIGTPRYDDIAVAFSPAQCSPLFDSIEGFLSFNYQRKDGEILVADGRGKVQRRIRFIDGLLTSVTLPATGAIGADASIGVVMAVEWSRFDFPGGRVSLPAVQAPSGPLGTSLALAGLPAVDVRTEPITIATAVSDDPGDTRDYLTEPGSLEVPNLVFFVPDADRDPFLAWYDDFIIRGNNGPDNEKTGSLVYLSPNRQQLVTLELRGVGIAGLRSGDDGTWEVKLYAEEMEIESALSCAP